MEKFKFCIRSTFNLSLIILLSNSCTILKNNNNCISMKDANKIIEQTFRYTEIKPDKQGKIYIINKPIFNIGIICHKDNELLTPEKFGFIRDNKYIVLISSEETMKNPTIKTDFSISISRSANPDELIVIYCPYIKPDGPWEEIDTYNYIYRYRKEKGKYYIFNHWMAN